jgi:hypothetical protein
MGPATTAPTTAPAAAPMGACAGGRLEVAMLNENHTQECT